MLWTKRVGQSASSRWFDPDFLTAHLALSPVMEEIGALAEDFQGSLLSQAILLDGLNVVVSKLVRSLSGA